MSVMVISDETYAKVTNSLFFNHKLEVKQRIERHAWDWDMMVKTVNKLRAANLKSYDERYNVINTSAEPLKSIMREQGNAVYEHDAQTLKALQAIRYNIEIEGFDFAFIDDAITGLTNAIIEALPEYQAADWG